MKKFLLPFALISATLTSSAEILEQWNMDSATVTDSGGWAYFLK
jgi:hypothetical protein